MKLRLLSYTLLIVATISVLVSGISIWLSMRHRQPLVSKAQVVAARDSTPKENGTLIFPLNPQVVVGTPEVGVATIPPYTYRNDREAPNQFRSLYLINTTTGKEIRMGDDSGVADSGAMDEHYLLWHFLCEPECRTIADGLHAYSLTTAQDTLVAAYANNGIRVQIAGNWVAFGKYNGDGSRQATLYAANLQTSEIITLTQALWARDGMTNEYFGIGSQLAAWYDAVYDKPVGISIYDLATRTLVTKLTNINDVFGERLITIYDVAAGETVVTWSGGYGYDLVTQSHFRIPRFEPPVWNKPSVFKKGRITEENRKLYQILELKDGSQVEIRAPLLDATPSTEPCIDGQNLVQNGDLESTTDHVLWQQSGSPTNLLVNDPPTGLVTGGQWAIRLGRFNNAQQAIQQTVAIPSGVKALTLTFAVRVYSWDLWGGDRLQVDLVDPLNGQSLLATPVQWTNVQLASGDWIPMQVAIQNWPGIDTPVDLIFRAQTDWAFPTDFTVDQVKLLTACLSE